MQYKTPLSLFMLILMGSLLACFGGSAEDEDTQESLTCAEASAEEVGALFGLDKTCEVDSDCTVITTGCNCPTPVNKSGNTDTYLMVRQMAMDTCGDAYFEGCQAGQCAFEVDESSVVCNAGVCSAPASGAQEL